MARENKALPANLYSMLINGLELGLHHFLRDAKAFALEMVHDLGYDDPAAYPWGVDVEIRRGRVLYRSEDSGKTWTKLTFCGK